jgi:hypothetical protein
VVEIENAHWKLVTSSHFVTSVCVGALADGLVFGP